MKLPFQIDLSGKVVVLTGGAGILCAEFARALAQSGAKVALLDRDGQRAEALAAELRANGAQAMAIAADVLQRASLEAAASQLAQQWGGCDLLINGAGGNHPDGTTTLETLTPEAMADDSLSNFFDLTTAGMEFVFDLNVLGTLLPTQVFARHMLGRPGCSIINISSMSALRPLTRIPAYSAAKAAISNLTQWLAVHFAPQGIRVNALAPGFFLTEQNHRLLIDEQTGQFSPRAQKIIQHTPMRRFGEPQELIGALLWLASDAASGFVNGSIIPVDGGFAAYSGV